VQNVVVSSAGAIMANPKISEYAAAKSALLGMVWKAALEYGEQGIRINAVLLGAMETPMFAKTFSNMAE
jgi:2,5-dichloro-2,5-cyclohexadiene-1,4-diol dehydrogenase 1